MGGGVRFCSCESTVLQCSAAVQVIKDRREGEEGWNGVGESDDESVGMETLGVWKDGGEEGRGVGHR